MSGRARALGEALERRRMDRRTLTMGTLRELARGSDRRKSQAADLDRARVNHWLARYHAARA